MIEGNCLAVLREMASDSVDAIVTDPPAAISFMGAAWDGDKGGRKQWIAWMSEVAAECMRVIKPGGHALVWSLPRTSHWTATAWEDAGWELRECIVHVFGSGFPKSLNISKAIDNTLKMERRVVGSYTIGGLSPDRPNFGANDRSGGKGMGFRPGDIPITAPATSKAQQFDGYGTALKPSQEMWWLLRKPLSEPTVARQVLATGTGAINIDACRVGYEGGGWNGLGDTHDETQWRLNNPDGVQRESGRWPSNLILTHSADCQRVGMRVVRGITGGGDGNAMSIFGTDVAHSRGKGTIGYADENGNEQVPAYDCAPDCPVAEMDRQSGDRKSGTTPRHYKTLGYHGNGHGASPSNPMDANEGGASRFFPQFEYADADFFPFRYVAKAPKTERNRGCEGIDPTSQPHNLSSNACANCGLRVKANGSGKKCECGDSRETTQLEQGGNNHPTVKPLQLIRWLITLITPPSPDAVILDPFLGSGTTLVAAKQLGVNAIGIEQSPNYANIALARIAAITEGEASQPKVAKAKKQTATKKPAIPQGTLL